RPRHRVGARRHRHHLLVRGLAASLLRAARVAAAVETVVAALLGTVPLLSEPAPPARGAARVRRFHSSVSGVASCDLVLEPPPSPAAPTTTTERQLRRSPAPRDCRGSGQFQ